MKKRVQLLGVLSMFLGGINAAPALGGGEVVVDKTPGDESDLFSPPQAERPSESGAYGPTRGRRRRMALNRLEKHPVVPGSHDKGAGEDAAATVFKGNPLHAAAAPAPAAGKDESAAGRGTLLAHASFDFDEAQRKHAPEGAGEPITPLFGRRLGGLFSVPEAHDEELTGESELQPVGGESLVSSRHAAARPGGSFDGDASSISHASDSQGDVSSDAEVSNFESAEPPLPEKPRVEPREGEAPAPLSTNVPLETLAKDKVLEVPLAGQEVPVKGKVKDSLPQSAKNPAAKKEVLKEELPGEPSFDYALKNGGRRASLTKFVFEDKVAGAAFTLTALAAWVAVEGYRYKVRRQRSIFEGTSVPSFKTHLAERIRSMTSTEWARAVVVLAASGLIGAALHHVLVSGGGSAPAA